MLGAVLPYGIVAAALLAAVATFGPAHAGEKTRVVTAGASLTEVVYALGAESMLVGTDLTSQYPAPALKTPKVAPNW